MENDYLLKTKALDAREASLRKQIQEQISLATKRATETMSAQHKKDLESQRAILTKDRDVIVLKKQAELNREREAFQKKIKELERHLEKKTSNEIGDGAEIDLFELLKENFPHDNITRVQKGQPGADIVHKVQHKGVVCGRIIYDSKHREAWQNLFASKLREDQIAMKADHAILSTTVFPSGKKELCLQEGIIIANPARVAHIAELLRNAVVKMHIRGLSLQERTGKMNKLYEFITSERCAQLFGEAGKVTDDILDLDVEEGKEHQRVWKTRGRLAVRLKNILREVDVEISGIVETPKQQTADAVA